MPFVQMVVLCIKNSCHVMSGNPEGDFGKFREISRDISGNPPLPYIFVVT
jgi:hypothetical protein